MSYILEALKKAEAERRSGTAPSLHTPHSFAPARTARAWWRHPVTWAGLVVLLATGAVVWQLTRPAAPPVQLAAAPAPAPAAPQQPAAAVPPPPAPAPAPAVSAAPPEPRPATAEVKPEAKPKPDPKPQPRPKPTPRKQESKASPTDAKPAEAKPAEQTAAPVPPLRELPEHIQREIPPLQIGGYIYSPAAADRSVLINKRLVREGDEVAPGLTLEKMTPSGMVLNYRGHRYRSSY